MYGCHTGTPLDYYDAYYTELAFEIEAGRVRQASDDRADIPISWPRIWTLVATTVGLEICVAILAQWAS